MKRGILILGLLALPLVLVASLMGEAFSAAGNPATGASLFEACVPCHTLNGNGVAGLPVDVLMQKMTQYQTIVSDNPKIQGMQQALQPMSQQDLMDLAAYISQM